MSRSQVFDSIGSITRARGMEASHIPRRLDEPPVRPPVREEIASAPAASTCC
ncbi:hypothetical protein AB0392_37940 [Nonomuraea angiospora]|uniref:hypothetical protein n=1 Tax=Nonomuraea angiospora TaxID=46172 RepID=UPI00344F34BC